jgi:lipopolysaccharide assembly outer membrane protein LptD (OstA)
MGVPVLWAPYMIYPLKTDRATGFLFPEWNASDRRGNDIGLPFFWAVSDQMGVLFKAAYLTKRGFMPSVLGDYVFGAKSSGAFYGAWIDDTSIEPNDPSTPFGSERWAIEWLHDHYLPYDWRWVVDARALSDNLYPFDFQEFSNERKDRYIQSRTFLENRFGPVDEWGFYAQLLWADDAQNPDDVDRDKFLLQRLPQLHGSVMPTPAGPLERLGMIWSMDADYTHYWAQQDTSDVFPDQLELQRVTGVTTVPNAAADASGATSAESLQLQTETVQRQLVVDDVFVDTGIEAIPDGRERNQFGDIVRGDGTVQLANGNVITTAQYIAMRGGEAALIDPTLGIGVDGSLDDFPPGPEGDGLFEEGEPLADRGHRLIVNPRLARPFRLFDVLEVLPEVGWHGTFYETDLQGFNTRNLFTFQLDVRTRMRRTLELPFDMGAAVHLLEPRFQYTAVTSDSQDGNPLFTPKPFVTQQRLRELALANVTRDWADRISSANALTLGAGNRFFVAREDGEGTRLFADVDVAIQYDFANDGLQGFVIDGGLWPGFNIRGDFSLGWDFLNHELGEAAVGVGWTHPEGHELRVFYRYVPNAPRFFENFAYDQERFDEFKQGFLEINQLTFAARWAVTRSWALTYRLSYSFEQSLFLTNQVGVEYISRCRCWAVRVELDQDRTQGFQVNLRYRLIGLGDDTVRPFAQRGRRTSRDEVYQDNY